MNVAITGSRSITDARLVRSALEQSGLEITELLSGGARGVDHLAEAWAKEKGIPIRRIKPDWKRNRKGAGLEANREIFAEADAVIAVWDGESRGTADMIERTRAAGKPLVLRQTEGKRAP